MRELTQISEFQQLLDSDKPFVIWFGATWCGPCRDVDAAEVEKQAKRLGLAIFHCDVDAGKKIAATCNISKIPTFMSFIGGEPDRKITTSITPAITGFLEQVADRVNPQ